MPTSESSSPAGALNHVAIAVKDLDVAIAVYERLLGIACSGRERVEEQGVDVGFFGEGPGRIELICPFTASSGVARFLEKRGEGLHHLCLDVADLATTLEGLKREGVPLIDELPRPGAGGSQIAFVHPKGSLGVLVELRQAVTAQTGVQPPLPHRG